MMWALAIKSKLTAALLLGVVLVTVIVTNFSERNSSKKINMAIASIYKDRLVVEGYIFEYAQLLQQVEKVAESSEMTVNEKRAAIAQKIFDLKKLHELYEATTLTDEEKNSYKNFVETCSKVEFYANEQDYKNIKTTTANAHRILNTLSSIQMSEAKLQMENVSKINNLSSIISRFELVILIVIAVIVQILVLSSKTMVKVNMPDNVHLN